MTPLDHWWSQGCYQYVTARAPTKREQPWVGLISKGVCAFAVVDVTLVRALALVPGP